MGNVGSYYNKTTKRHSVIIITNYLPKGFIAFELLLNFVDFCNIMSKNIHANFVSFERSLHGCLVKLLFSYSLRAK